MAGVQNWVGWCLTGRGAGGAGPAAEVPGEQSVVLGAARGAQGSVAGAQRSLLKREPASVALCDLHLVLTASRAGLCDLRLGSISNV